MGISEKESKVIWIQVQFDEINDNDDDDDKTRDGGTQSEERKFFVKLRQSLSDRDRK